MTTHKKLRLNDFSIWQEKGKTWLVDKSDSSQEQTEINYNHGQWPELTKMVSTGLITQKTMVDIIAHIG